MMLANPLSGARSAGMRRWNQFSVEATKGQEWIAEPLRVNGDLLLQRGPMPSIFNRFEHLFDDFRVQRYAANGIVTRRIPLP
jgi:hypothetical protein